MVKPTVRFKTISKLQKAFDDVKKNWDTGYRPIGSITGNALEGLISISVVFCTAFCSVLECHLHLIKHNKHTYTSRPTAGVRN